ncbi:MAG: tRNA (adenosine(37)-N6)-threonylcarbamoyltransferase complex dimerization subunit type 1 TsaB [Merdibacter sp.]
MKTLCMDTAHKNLIVALYENDRMICGIAREAWKRQSEDLFPAIIECMEKAGWDSTDLDEVVITDGPGSYTGVRIAMTVAVLCTRLNIRFMPSARCNCMLGWIERVGIDGCRAPGLCPSWRKGALKAPCVMTLEEIEQLAAQVIFISMAMRS